MRTREEIRIHVERKGNFGTLPVPIEHIILEVLLDIRDLLTSSQGIEGKE